MRDLLDDCSNPVPVGKRGHGDGHEIPASIEFVRAVYRRTDVQPLKRFEKRRQVMLGIVRASPARAGYGRKRFSDVLRIIIREKRIYLAERIQGICDIDQFCIDSCIAERAVRRIRCHHLAHVSDMNLP